ncbi:ATP-dependent exoDNAse (exonuclease V) beta subunit (contains helicase and exonuclease domains) [Flaviramulus basaltis]|uniref:DNA 3'-5' helicase n=1 Tax=Flaviramulus basaltis TaxID=369401 RepID=A0A1K2ID72_9FLAO|nr:UvrD-helicase domain-containing protein [Flaviramulus basaltis]SFZ90380.1 ATP-dependent exoDNAse (exonuclease V) beta subunit (contains helicase and exonuclease domains) [Flaviramulus basaltis]
MQTPTPFTIYNASAGSGKTYTLVKEYLKILFASNNSYLFKNILAITFTNKAVAEMKDRIIDMLKKFADKDILENPNDMFTAIHKDLKIEPEDLQKKADKLLNTIIHNYAAFDISTIDGFTHKLIRTFAYDLKLPLNFEVELDQDVLLNEAVDSLISKAGTDKELTKVLVDFAIEKADDDKSWDVAFDFNKIAKLLVNENDIPFIEKLKDKTLDDFKTLKTQLKKEVVATEIQIVEKAQNILNLIEEAGLQFDDFSGSYLPKHFQKLSKTNFDVNFEAKWQEDIETKTLYPKRVTNDIASTIEQIQPQIGTAFNETKQAFFHLKFLKSFYKNITPLSVLNAINKELKALKEEQNKMLISEFNSIISKEIKEQPTPFIYERIGEKFNHYFIDEFQDTSVMQWENLIPLLGNSLSTETGSTMLVGDAKQAIYRWRGGKAEQFISLFNKNNQPFPFTQQHIENLPANYRSFKEIVDFNNGFFKFLANQVFNKDDYKTLYENSNQNITKNENGYVELSFLDIEKEDDRDEFFSEHVLKTINSCLENGYNLEDICVLVRKKKEGVAIANYLSQNKIPIISSETLLIYNAPEVGFINNVLALLIQPKNNEIKISVLNYLASSFNIEDKHAFFSAHLNLSLPDLFKNFEAYNIFIKSENLLQLPLYDLAETIVRSFNLVETSNAYIQFYLDIVLDFSQKKGSDISGFLEYFEKKKESLSIISPKGQNAIQIMTIHKSKGLEFPVVIFPYADLDIYRELEPKEWFKLDNEKYAGFSHTLLNYNKDFEHFGEEGLNIFNNHQSEQELDNINLLYVTLTRAVEQLFVISKKDISAKGEINSKKYSGLFINYLQHLGLWNDSELKYSFGDSKRKTQNKTPSKETTIQHQFISTSKEEHNIKVVTKSGLLWDTNQQEAIEKGNLLHDIMSKINTKNDIDSVIHDFINTSLINKEQAETLKPLVFQIVEHPNLKDYFSSNYTIYNERDIITKNGVILRPDRVAINSENQAIIIDYKTGVEDKKHEQQLQLYQDVLEEMKLQVKKKILVYINDDIKIKDV